MSFQIALSGIDAASTDLSVIGNNVANAGTTGFKMSRTEFADIYAAALPGFSGGQTGSGVRVSDVTQQFSQGTLNYTNSSLDLAINGGGFFKLNDINGAPIYTRAGAFHVDRYDNVVNAQGQKLQVFQADKEGSIIGTIGDLVIERGDIAPKSTATVTAQLNLDANETIITHDWNWTAPETNEAPLAPASNTYNHTTSTTVFDSLGNSHLSALYFSKIDNNQWKVHTFIDGVEQFPTDTPDSPMVLDFDDTGVMTGPQNDPLDMGQVKYGPIPVLGGAQDMEFTLDLGGTTQFGGLYDVLKVDQDGYTTGRLSGTDIQADGIVYANYTNGKNRALGQLVMANFANPQGLSKLGDTNWGESYKSGPPLVGTAGTSSLGTIQSSALEDSNVDLTKQLVNMIVAQRNFQANSQVISTENAVTQTIINLR